MTVRRLALRPRPRWPWWPQCPRLLTGPLTSVRDAHLRGDGQRHGGPDDVVVAAVGLLAGDLGLGAHSGCCSLPPLRHPAPPVPSLAAWPGFPTGSLRTASGLALGRLWSWPHPRPSRPADQHAAVAVPDWPVTDPSPAPPTGPPRTPSPAEYVASPATACGASPKGASKDGPHPSNAQVAEAVDRGGRPTPRYPPHPDLIRTRAGAPRTARRRQRPPPSTPSGAIVSPRSTITRRRPGHGRRRHTHATPAPRPVAAAAAGRPAGTGAARTPGVPVPRPLHLPGPRPRPERPHALECFGPGLVHPAHLPSPADVGRSIVLLALEVMTGRRPVTQLRAVTTPGLFASLSGGRRRGGAPSARRRWCWAACTSASRSTGSPR